MDKTKKIYFLFSFVMIIACYALNKSYSMFVASEEKNVVDSVVPNLVSELSVSSITLSGNEEYLIKETITNTSSVSINYALNANGSNYTIKMTSDEGNKVLGSLETNQSDIVYLYVKNDSTESNTITFELNKNYTTLNNDLTSNIDSTNLYTPVTGATVPYQNEPNTLKYHILNNYINSDLYTGTAPSQTNTTAVEAFNGKTENTIKLPLSSGTVEIPELTTINGSESEEKGLYKAPDDYGDSYYFRGASTKNYVEFSGMCFRIIRIQGDGSIRLILASESSCSSITDSTSATSFATTGGVGVVGSKMKAHYGYSGKISSRAVPDYINNYGQTTNRKSNARTMLNTWLTNKELNTMQDTFLKNDVWCLGNGTHYDLNGTGNIVTSTSVTVWYFISGNKFNVTNEVSYTCETSATTDTNYIGMITYDEVIYAGCGVPGSSSSYCYLADNTKYSSSSIYENYWLTLSPSKQPNGPAKCFQLEVGTTKLSDSYDLDFEMFIRPVITLVSGVKVSGDGIGTKDQPYIIQ